MRTEYLVVLLCIAFFPVLLSFNSEIALFRKRRALVKTILAVSLPFWAWDVLATWRGHWQFNPAYTIGVSLLGLPVEEWMFFVVVSFASIFTWESVKYFRRKRK